MQRKSLQFPNAKERKDDLELMHPSVYCLNQGGFQVGYPTYLYLHWRTVNPTLLEAAGLTSVAATYDEYLDQMLTWWAREENLTSGVTFDGANTVREQQREMLHMLLQLLMQRNNGLLPEDVVNVDNLVRLTKIRALAQTAVHPEALTNGERMVIYETYANAPLQYAVPVKDMYIEPLRLYADDELITPCDLEYIIINPYTMHPQEAERFLAYVHSDHPLGLLAEDVSGVANGSREDEYELYERYEYTFQVEHRTVFSRLMWYDATYDTLELLFLDGQLSAEMFLTSVAARARELAAD